MKFIHIPVQSGSEKVLKDMKRIHTVENFKLIVKKFREEFDNITISTDIIVGYPSETEEDFQKTLDLIKEIKPEVINISKFSSRFGTQASKLKQLASQVIDERSIRLNELYKEIKNSLR
jgi:tRNA A37 methylthiotransferase MiaB